MRQQRRQERQKRQRIIVRLSIALLAITLGVIYLVIQATSIPEQRLTAESTKPTKPMQESSSSTETKPEVKTITVTASGDMLYHTPVYLSAYDGKRYDFDNDFEQVKPLIASADLALGDFEGTINPNKPLGGFPLFNAPIDAVASIKDAGFDVIDLAHNHILDTVFSKESKQRRLLFTTKAWQRLVSRSTIVESWSKKSTGSKLLSWPMPMASMALKKA